MTIPTAHLEEGQWVFTGPPIGQDFAALQVAPPKGRRQERTVRKVRSVIRSQGGLVVRFEDGTKTRPLHGRTAWLPA
jgi:hypothetical protein